MTRRVALASRPAPHRLAVALFFVACACVLGLSFASTSVVGQCGYSSCSSCAAQATCKWCGTYSSSYSGQCISTGSSCSFTGYPYTYYYSTSCTNYSSGGGTTAGAIVGAVIGSIAFVVIACALCICIRRRFYLGRAQPGMVVIQQPAQAVVLSPQPVVYGSGQPASVHTVYTQQPPTQGQPQAQPFQGQPQTMGAQPVGAQPYYAAPPAYAQTYAQPPPQYAPAPGQQQPVGVVPSYAPQYGTEGMPQPAYAPQGVQYGQPMVQYPPQQQQPVYGAPANTTSH